MSNLQRVLARLLTDSEFRARVRREGPSALLEYHLTSDEVSAILHLALDQWDVDTKTGPWDDPLTIERI